MVREPSPKRISDQFLKLFFTLFPLRVLRDLCALRVRLCDGQDLPFAAFPAPKSLTLGLILREEPPALVPQQAAVVKVVHGLGDAGKDPRGGLGDEG